MNSVTGLRHLCVCSCRGCSITTAACSQPATSGLFSCPSCLPHGIVSFSVRLVPTRSSCFSAGPAVAGCAKSVRCCAQSDESMALRFTRAVFGNAVREAARARLAALREQKAAIELVRGAHTRACVCVQAHKCTNPTPSARVLVAD